MSDEPDDLIRHCTLTLIHSRDGDTTDAILSTEIRREYLLELHSYLGYTAFGLSRFRQEIHALTELALQIDF